MDLDLKRDGRRKAQAFESAVFDRLRDFLDEYESAAALAENYPRLIRDALRKNRVAENWWRWKKKVRTARKEEEEARVLIKNFQSETREQSWKLFNKIRQSKRRKYN